MSSPNNRISCNREELAIPWVELTDTTLQMDQVVSTAHACQNQDVAVSFRADYEESQNAAEAVREAQLSFLAEEPMLQLAHSVLSMALQPTSHKEDPSNGDANTWSEAFARNKRFQMAMTSFCKGSQCTHTLHTRI